VFLGKERTFILQLSAKRSQLHRPLKLCDKGGFSPKKSKAHNFYATHKISLKKNF